MSGFTGTTVYFQTSLGWVTPEQYGCIGNSNGTTGNGTDNTANFQTMLSSVPAGTTVVTAPGAIYRLTEAVHLSQNNITITGGGTLFFDATSFTAWIDAYPAALTISSGTATVASQSGSIALSRGGTILDRFTMRGIKITSLATAAAGVQINHKCLYPKGINQLVIEHCAFEGFGAEVITPAGVDEAWIENNRFYNCAFNAFGAFASRAIHFKNNILDTVGQLVETDGDLVEITGNIALNSGGPSYAGNVMAGIIVYPSSFDEPAKIIVEGNYIHSNPSYDAELGSAIKIGGAPSYSSDSLIQTLSVRNNTIDGGWCYGIGVFAPPSPTGMEVIENNTIRMNSSTNTPNLPEAAIYVYWNSSGYSAKAFTEVYNNTISHANSYTNLSIDISGAGLTVPPSVKLLGNKITTAAALTSEDDNSVLKYGGVIYIGYNVGNQIIRDNYVNGTRVGVRSVFGAAAGTINGSTAGYAKTADAIKYQLDSHTYSKGAADNLWNLTGVSTSNTQYLKVLLCLDSGGNGQIIAGTPAASQAAAQIPKAGLWQDWVSVGVVEIPNSYSGGSLSGFAFYDIIGEF